MNKTILNNKKELNDFLISNRSRKETNKHTHTHTNTQTHRERERASQHSTAQHSTAQKATEWVTKNSICTL